MGRPIIEAEGICKDFRLGTGGAQYLTLRDQLAGLFARNKAPQPETRLFRALDQVSFKVERGETLGVIGRNGAGKSTLLKVLSQITPPTSGKAVLRGRQASLLEVGTGFHQELTGRENIFLNGTILGMSWKEVRSKLDEIVAFAEVERFLDTPVKRYSSGMYVRLAFAVAAHLEPEILIVDEVLAVGDAQFQKRCLGKMGEVARGGRTVLFVSHNMSAVRSLCRTGMVLQQGKVVYHGNASDAVEKYLTECSAFDGNGSIIEIPHHLNTVKEYLTVSRIGIVDSRGVQLNGPMMSGTDYFLEADLEIKKFSENLACFVAVYSESDELLFVADIHDSRPDAGQLLGPGRKRVSLQVPTHLFASRRYKLEFSAVVHYKGWALPPDPSMRIDVDYLRDPEINRMGYDDSNHPFTGSSRPGILGPVLNWRVQELDSLMPDQHLTETADGGTL